MRGRFAAINRGFNRSVRFVMLVALTALLCITVSPVFAVPGCFAGVCSGSTSQSVRDPQVMDRQGRSHYEAGAFSDAAIAFQQAAEAYQAKGDRLRQALSLSNLALSQRQLGNWPEANQAIAASLQLLDPFAAGSGQKPLGLQALAQALDIQGELQLAQAQPAEAAATWARAAELHLQSGNRDRATESQVNQAQALQELGLYQRAIALLYVASGLEQQAPAAIGNSLQNLQLTDLQTLLVALPANSTTVTALQSLAEALRVSGSNAQAQAVAQHALTLAEQLQLPNAVAAAKLRLANILRTEALADLALNNLSLAEAIAFVTQFNQQGDRFGATDTALSVYDNLEEALTLYQQASTATTPATQTWAQLNSLTVLLETEQWAIAAAQIPHIQQQLQTLPLSHLALSAQIYFAQVLMKAQRQKSLAPEVIEPLLATVVQQAEILQDRRSQSYAFGTLGHWYEQLGQPQAALPLTRQALLLAQAIQAADVAYRWQWQLGRLLKGEGDRAGAIVAYQEAIQTLNSIRSDLVAIPSEEQFSFRNTIEPLHRELVALLLASETASAEPLKTAREIIESLQQAELINFFQEDCLEVNPVLVDQVDPQAVVFYPILLPDRLAVIVSLPQAATVNLRDSSVHCTSSSAAKQSLCYYMTPVPQSELENAVSRLRNALAQANDPGFLSSAQTLYDWLIRPIEPALAQLTATGANSGVEPTLVFVPDGILRTIPMSVLHDGTRYLIERYSIALTPGLQLLGDRPLPSEKLSALLGGLQEARQGFSPLSNVTSEIQHIESEIASSYVLFDQDFTTDNIARAIQTISFPIVHLATHGQFSSQRDQTFLLTWDGRLTVNQLRSLLQTTELQRETPLELLVLSACETATGDNQAALGLAGVAVRSGARSTLATLWQVNDASSALLMENFYAALIQPGITKAKALQQAQRSLLQTAEYQRPYYWAAYVLIGNWQ